MLCAWRHVLPAILLGLTQPAAHLQGAPVREWLAQGVPQLDGFDGNVRRQCGRGGGVARRRQCMPACSCVRRHWQECRAAQRSYLHVLRSCNTRGARLITHLCATPLQDLVRIFLPEFQRDPAGVALGGALLIACVPRPCGAAECSSCCGRLRLRLGSCKPAPCACVQCVPAPPTLRSADWLGMIEAGAKTQRCWLASREATTHHPCRFLYWEGGIILHEIERRRDAARHGPDTPERVAPNRPKTRQQQVRGGQGCECGPVGCGPGGLAERCMATAAATQRRCSSTRVC